MSEITPEAALQALDNATRNIPAIRDEHNAWKQCLMCLGGAVQDNRQLKAEVEALKAELEALKQKPKHKAKAKNKR